MERPPTPTRASSLLGERLNQRRIVPASRPQAPSLSSAITENTANRTSIWAITYPRAGSTNCGSTAEKKMTIFGFVAPTT